MYVKLLAQCLTHRQYLLNTYYLHHHLFVKVFKGLEMREFLKDYSAQQIIDKKWHVKQSKTKHWCNNNTLPPFQYQERKFPQEITVKEKRNKGQYIFISRLIRDNFDTSSSKFLQSSLHLPGGQILHQQAYLERESKKILNVSRN